MLIEALEISGAGTFRDPVALGPFQPGLNILAQPNEWGKSTVFHALCRALFDRYRSEREEIKQLRPAGTSLSPRIELTFTARGERFRLRKQFLDGRASELSRWSGAAWQRTDESDKADQRVRELVGAPALEGQSGKASTWGLLQYLWCRQDEPCAWPDWDGDCGTTRNRLATVEIDALMGQVAARLEARAGEQFTGRGQVKKGSALHLAESERATAEAELTDCRASRRDLEELDRQYEFAVGELPKLERVLAARTAEASLLRSQKEAVELLQGEILRARTEHAAAEAALRHLRQERETQARNTAAIAAEEQAQGTREARIAQASASVVHLLERLQQAEADVREHERLRAERADQLARGRALAQQRASAERVALLMVTQNHVGTRVRDLEQCAERLAVLPALSEKDLELARGLERRLDEQRARLSAAGLSVRLEPSGAARLAHAVDGASPTALDLAAAQTVHLQAARALALDLAGWGRVSIESGAQETAQLEREIAETDGQLGNLLQQAGAATLAEAVARAEQRREWAVQQGIARAELTALLTEWKTLGELAMALQKSQVELAQSRARHAFTEEEQSQSDLALQKAEQALAAAELADRKEGKRLEQELTARRAELAHAQAVAAAAREEIARSAGRLKTLREQSAALLERHPGGFEAALAGAEDQFMRTETRLAVAQRKLPADAESLAGRAAQAERAVAELEAAQRASQREVDRLKTVLGERGGAELYGREVAAAERLEKSAALARRLRREGLAARLVGELIQRREQASIRAVLTPLEERLTQTFATLTGVAGRRVWFDEHLAVQGVGYRREELIPFDQLSRGAREQLLLALRTAIALVVAETEGPQCLVLDDVLVHTDPARHANVVGFLQTLPASVQVLLLTCHAERYGGVGQVVQVTRGEERRGDPLACLTSSS